MRVSCWLPVSGVACGVESSSALHASANASIDRMDDEAWSRYVGDQFQMWK